MRVKRKSVRAKRQVPGAGDPRAATVPAANTSEGRVTKGEVEPRMRHSSLPGDRRTVRVEILWKSGAYPVDVSTRPCAAPCGD
jgi:hypothetical protein